jgi:hypothetical protein
MNPAAPSPRDWPEDFAHENGCYLHICCHCHERFTGHKRRVVCKACADAGATENQRREGLLTAAGLSPVEWALATPAEMHRIHGEYAGLLLDLYVERKQRRELAAAFTRLAKCISETRGANAHYALQDGRETVAESERLDEEIAKRETARNAPAPAPAP